MAYVGFAVLRRALELLREAVGHGWRYSESSVIQVVYLQIGFEQAIIFKHNPDASACGLVVVQARSKHNANSKLQVSATP